MRSALEIAQSERAVALSDAETWRQIAEERAKERNADRAEAVALRDQLTATQDALDYLHGTTTTEFAELRKDAERYQWLREHVHLTVWVSGDGMDAAIDAARSKT